MNNRRSILLLSALSLTACTGNSSTDASTDTTATTDAITDATTGADAMDAVMDSVSDAATDSTTADAITDAATGADAMDAVMDSVSDTATDSTTVDTTAIDAPADAAGDGATDTGTPSGPCAPGAACTRIDPCLAETDNSGQTNPALRIDQWTISEPHFLSVGIVASVISSAFLTNAPTCNLNGMATTNWILEPGSGPSLLRLGAARSRSTAGTPFTLVDETVPVLDGATFHVQPIRTPLSSSGGMLSSTATDVILPVYLDAAGTRAVLLPISSAVVSFVIDPTNTCIGSYNAAGLDPASSCTPDSTHPAYLNGGHLSGYITLETADLVPIATIGESLCVLLTGNPVMYGNGSTPVNRCRRDAAGAIVFRGNWCASSNDAATSTCADAVRVDTAFAASGVPAT